MVSFTNYSLQPLTIQAESPYQLMLLKLTDASTLVRELSKVGTVAGLVVSASSVFINVSLTTTLSWTAAFGVSWLISRNIAQRLEPHAKDMLAHFKNLQEGRDTLRPIGVSAQDL